MKSRAEKIARVVAVQRQLHRLAEWQLMQLQRRENELHDEERHLIGSLNDDEPPRGMFARTIVKRLNAIGRETGVVGKARQTQSDVLLAESRKLKHVEKKNDIAAAAEERDGEKRRLEEAVGDAAVHARNRAARNEYGR